MFHVFFQERCRESFCAPGKIPTENGSCASALPKTNVYGYFGCYIVIAESDLISFLSFTLLFSTPKADLREVFTISQQLSCYSDLLGIAPTHSAKIVQIAFAAQLPIDRDDLDDKIASLGFLQLVESNKNISADEKLRIVKLPSCKFGYLNSTLNIFQNHKESEQDCEGSHNRPDIRRGKPLDAYFLQIGPLLSCQFTSFSADEYDFNVRTWEIILRTSGIVISAERVSIDFDNNSLFVCLNDIKASTSISDSTESTHEAILTWLSYSSTVISMTSCFLTFIVYSCFKSMRSSVGINNMLLSFFTFFAQGIVQFLGNQTSVPTLCFVIGVVGHFFWLSATTCMTTSTFHLFYALSFPVHHLRHKDKDILMITYILIILTVPIMFITASMVFYKVIYNKFGYGNKSNCFLDSGLPKQLFFGLPILLSVLANSGMYVFTVVRLVGMPRISNTLSNKRKLKVYAKLSILTGAAWIFGFLYEITDILVFAYAYVITAHFVGLALFLGFITNRRVFRLFVAKWPCLGYLFIKTKSGRTSSTGMCDTENTYQSSVDTPF